MSVAVLVLLAVASLIQERRDSAASQQPTGTGVVRGRVIASDTGLPIRHGSVMLSMLPPTQLAADRRAAAPDLSAYEVSLGRPRQTTTDAEGAFEFKSLPAGRYRLHASPGQYANQYLSVNYGARSVLVGGDPGRAITIRPGDVFDKARIVLPRGGVITGRITDEQGRFQMQDVGPGSYRLSIRPGSSAGSPDPSPVDAAEMALVPVTVVDADVAGIIVVLTRGATITGEIVFEPGPPPSTRSPLRISAVPRDEESYAMMREPAVVNPDLKFTMNGLIGEIVLRTGASNATLKQVLSDGMDITDTPHAFKEGDRVTIVLTSRTSTIEGNVTNDHGAPVTEPAAVIIFPEEKARWRTSSVGIRRASVDENGHFVMRSLLGGRYYILAASPARLFVPGVADPTFFEALVRDATRIFIGEDEQRSVDLKLVALGDQ